MNSSSSFRRLLVSLLLLFISGAGECSRRASRSIDSSFLDFGPAVSRYVVGNLPNVNFNLSTSLAGQIPVANTSNDELFFWLFEAETQASSDDFISR